ncbi:MAG: aldo/keto reductase [Truepera sp.]|nr:aldo/keto reductase [Truepera sp.]
MERNALTEALTISRVVTGLWQIADMERDSRDLDPETTAAAMTPYVEAGLTSFDMADHYGSAEEIAGLFRERHGSDGELQLLTKWVPPPGTVTRADVRAAVERSLERMRVERLDLLQFHTWTYADPAWLDCLLWLQELKWEGLIGAIGLTNFDTAHLRVALESGIEVVSNQVCFSLLDQRPAREMIELCLQRGVKILAYGTLAGGLLSDRWLGKERPPRAERTWSQMKYLRFIAEAGGWEVFQHLLGVLDGVARRLGVTIANVASRSILEQRSVAGVIIGARLGHSEHIRESLDLFRFSLDRESRSRIAEALTLLRPIPGDSGDEYRKPPFLTASGDLSHHVESFPAPFEARTGAGGRHVVLTGTRWEELAGFCRAVRLGERILVSGTTATHADRVVGGTDAAAQLHFVVDKIEAVLHSLGGRLEDVIRTRVFVRDLSDWERVSQAHGARFREILPTNTLVQASLVGDDYLVEMEAEAVVGEGR